MRVLVDDIVGGALKEGALLPSEALLARQFGVSVQVVRECRRGLEERGLVEVRQGLGAIVTSPSDWDQFDAEVLSAMLASPVWRSRVVREFLECRWVVDVEAAGLAAERASPGDVEMLRGACRSMVETAMSARSSRAAERRFFDADVAFHEAVGKASGNRGLGWLLRPLHDLPDESWLIWCSRDRVERELEEHEQIVRAIETGDAIQARDAMWMHLASVASDVQAHLAAAGG